jgi:hypothetical protein
MAVVYRQSKARGNEGIKLKKRLLSEQRGSGEHHYVEMTIKKEGIKCL